jgi:hypothetical protein
LGSKLSLSLGLRRMEKGNRPKTNADPLLKGSAFAVRLTGIQKTPFAYERPVVEQSDFRSKLKEESDDVTVTLSLESLL